MDLGHRGPIWDKGCGTRDVWSFVGHKGCGTRDVWYHVGQGMRDARRVVPWDREEPRREPVTRSLETSPPQRAMGLRE
jgi:hypothetical protein